jgi:hypothetical protein
MCNNEIKELLELNNQEITNIRDDVSLRLVY